MNRNIKIFAVVANIVSGILVVCAVAVITGGCGRIDTAIPMQASASAVTQSGDGSSTGGGQSSTSANQSNASSSQTSKLPSPTPSRSPSSMPSHSPCPSPSKSPAPSCFGSVGNTFQIGNFFNFNTLGCFLSALGKLNTLVSQLGQMASQGTVPDLTGFNALFSSFLSCMPTGTAPASNCTVIPNGVSPTGANTAQLMACIAATVNDLNSAVSNLNTSTNGSTIDVSAINSVLTKVEACFASLK